MKSSQISVADLKALLEVGEVKVVDGSWALDGRDMQASYAANHIAGAVFFDLEAISDRTSPLPHMAPHPEGFARAVSAMGISDKSHVVVYDQAGLFSAARVWWTFRLMGHEKVQVLSGGLPAWVKAGYPVTSEQTYTQPASYQTQYDANLVIDLKNLREFSGKILDARPSARFEGTAPEPRKGLRSGHIPKSLNLPFAELIQNGTLRTKAELQDIMARYDLMSDSVVTSCGSGVTAAILSMALYEIGHTDVRLYDGSWAEWGQDRLDTPVETGR